MKLCDFLECVDEDVLIEYKDSYVKFGRELCGEDLQEIFSKRFLDQYVYSVSIYDDCFKVIFTQEDSEW